MLDFSNFDITVDNVPWVSEQHMTREWRFDTSKHKSTFQPNYYSMRFIICGSYDREYKTKEKMHIKEGAFSLLTSEHILYVDTSIELPFRYYQIYFYTTTEINPEFFHNGQSLIYPKNTDRIEMLFIKAQEIFLEKPLTWKLELKAIVNELLSIFINAQHNKERKKLVPTKVRKSAEYIKNNIFSTKISINELARSQNISTEHFIRIFKEAYGVSPKKYIISLRLNRAADLLKSTGRTVSEIAEDSGFPNIFYFNKIFKEEYGITPTEYRKKYTFNPF